MTRKRSISHIIGEVSRDRPFRSLHLKPQKRKKVHCDCSKCNGKLVLERTKLLHNTNDTNDSDGDDSSENENTSIIQNTTNPEVVELYQEDENQASISTSALGGYIENQSWQTIEDTNNDRDTNTIYSFLPRKRVKRKSHPTFEPVPADRELELTIDDMMSEYTSEQNAESSINDSEANVRSSFAEIFEDYSPPLYEEMDMTEPSVDSNFLWILLWIMSFRTRFNIPETATESLIKFMKLVLEEIGSDKFKNFPDSIYLAKKALGLKDQFQSFVPCTKCHKLYSKQEVENFRQNETLTIMKCNHVEFPNSARRRLHFCNTPLSQQTDSLTIQPELIFPFARIRQQLINMYRRQDFEKSLRHWSDRQQFDNILTDMDIKRIF